MPYCPDCRIDYEEGFEACTDCGQTLVAGSMPEGPAPSPASEEKWTPLMRVRKKENAEIVRGLLESEGIECEVIDKTFSEMPVPALETVSFLEIWVPEAQAPEARGLLNEVREGTVPCSSCGHMSAADEPSCEYCGAPR